MCFVYIPPGQFLMGSPDSELHIPADQHPQHLVRITQSFCLGMHPVTVGQFRQFVEATRYATDGERDGKEEVGVERGRTVQKPEFTWRNPGFVQADDRPVVNVSWNDASKFCEWLAGKEVRVYRLPSEAEWEYACRAGTGSRFHFGDVEVDLGKYAWFVENSRGATHPVGQKMANVWGLQDIVGNVWEWCQDLYAKNYYFGSPTDDPPGPSATIDLSRVSRGGSWYLSAANRRCAVRRGLTPAFRDHNTGFRVLVSVGPGHPQ